MRKQVFDPLEIRQRTGADAPPGYGLSEQMWARGAPPSATKSDRLSALPEEIFVNILQHAVLEPTSNVRAQRVSRRFCQTLRNDLFWQHVSPARPVADKRPAGAPSAPAYSAVAPGELAAPKVVGQTLYWQFQHRTSLQPRGQLSRQDQKLLCDLWTKTRPRPFILPLHCTYDVARAAAGFVGFPAHVASYARFGDDLHMMRDLAKRGPRFLEILGGALRTDICFARHAVFAHVDNHRLFAERLVGDERFFANLLRRHGSLLPVMPAPMRMSKEYTLLALETWAETKLAQSPSFSLLSSVWPLLQNDPQIVTACVRRCASSFLYAVANAPDGPWHADAVLVKLALQPYLYVNFYKHIWVTPTQVFNAVHESLRAHADIALQAVALDARNYLLVPPPLRQEQSWCLRAIAANNNVLCRLDFAPRHDLNLIRTLPPEVQLAGLYALRDTVGTNKDMLFALLRNPQLRQERNFFQALSSDRSIYQRINAHLRQQSDVLREILNFDGREIAYMLPQPRRNDGLQNYAAAALLEQLRVPYRMQAMRQTVAAAPRRLYRRGHPALGLFAQSRQFAALFLLSMPELDGFLAAEVRQDADILHLSRLGSLLQEASRTYSTQNGVPSVIKQLTANLRRRPYDFILHLTLSVFYIIRDDWGSAQHWLARTTTILAWSCDMPSLRRAFERLVAQLPRRCPTPEDAWYQQMMHLVHCCHQTSLSRAGCADDKST